MPFLIPLYGAARALPPGVTLAAMAAGTICGAFLIWMIDR